MNLEKINKEWITADDFGEALGVPRWMAWLMLENAATFYTTKRKLIDGIYHYGSGIT